MGSCPVTGVAGVKVCVEGVTAGGAVIGAVDVVGVDDVAPTLCSTDWIWLESDCAWASPKFHVTMPSAATTSARTARERANLNRMRFHLALEGRP